MPILEIKEGPSGPLMIKTCQPCKATDEIEVSKLILGTARFAEAISLPPCSKCRACETLIRSTDSSVPDSLSGHRKKVNALANYLTSTGKVDASSLAEGEKLAPAAPVGDLYGKVAPTAAPAEKDPVTLARNAIAAAQEALAAALAAQKK